MYRDVKNICILQIKREIEEFKAQGVRLEQEHRSILKNIEGKQEEAVKQANGYQQQLKGVMKILDQLKSGTYCIGAKTRNGYKMYKTKILWVHITDSILLRSFEESFAFTVILLSLLLQSSTLYAVDSSFSLIHQQEDVIIVCHVVDTVHS